MSDNAAVLAVELAANPQPLIDGFTKASQATGAWAEAAAKNMQKAQASFGGLDFGVVTSKAKAEQLKLIELQHQLDVARAAGERQTVVALSDEIALLQKVRQLRSAGLNQGDATSAARGTLNAVAAARAAAEAREVAAQRQEKLTGNPGQALAGAFARVRVGSFEEAGARVPIFGASLEELGAAGLVAAAGVAAAALAAEKAKEAMEFSEQLDKDAKSLGVTTTELQKFDYATSGTSVGIDKGREALSQFNEVFGRYSAGLAQGRTASALNGLGFTPESARQIGSTTEALEKALLALAKLQNPQQRAALADRLGLKDFLPVLAEGQEGVERFISTMEKAQGAGAVISPEDVRRAAELNDQLQQVQHTIDIEVKKAFIELAPFVLEIAKLIERAARAASSLAGAIPDLSRGTANLIPGVEGSAGKISKGGLASEVGALADPSGVGRATAGLLGGLVNRVRSDGKGARLGEEARSALSGRFDFSPYDDARTTSTGANLAGPKKPRAGPQDQTDSLDKAAVDAYQSALKSVATAIAALTGDVQAHADLEKQAVDDDLTKKLADLSKQEADIRKAKLDTHAREQLALIDKAKTEEQNAAAAKKEKIDRDAEQALREKALQRQQDADALTARGRTAGADLNGGAYAKARAELDNLRAQQLDEVDALRVKQQPQIDSGALSQSAADANVSDLQGVQRQEYLARRQNQQRQINPLYARANPTTSITDDLQGVEGKGLDQLSDGLTSVLTGTKDVKTAFHDMVTSIVADLARLLVQRSIEGPLANLLFGAQGGNNLGTSTGQGSVSIGAIGGSAATDFTGLTNLLTGASAAFGFASGTADAPGGMAEVGENGPEDILLPKGSQVIPSTQIGMPRTQAAAANVVVNVNATGAFGLDDLHAAVAGGVQAAVRLSGVQLQSYSKQASTARRNSLAGF